MSESVSALPDVLKLDRIERKPKKVFRAEGYKDYVGISSPDAPPQWAQDLGILGDCIENGKPIPDRFYRRNMQSSDDWALQRFGLMHLHLGGSGSDVLVFLYQFPEFIFFLQISNHEPFAERPPGIKVHNQFWPEVQAWFAEAALVALRANEAAKRTAADAKRKSAIRASALNRSIRESLGLGPKP